MNYANLSPDELEREIYLGNEAAKTYAAENLLDFIDGQDDSDEAFESGREEGWDDGYIDGQRKGRTECLQELRVELLALPMCESLREQIKAMLDEAEKRP